MIELTIQEACNYPQNFMYIWADEKKFLAYLPKEYAQIIRTKKANERKLLTLSAQKYNTTLDAYTEAIRNAFIEAFNMTPAEALIVLAQGGTVAGKNWDAGVFGVGALYTNTFSGHPEVTVRAEDGHIFKDGQDVTDTSKTVYTTIKKKAVPYQQFATIDSITYASQYNKTTKKFYAYTYSDAGGTYNARTGNTVNASDSADIWGSILTSLEKFLTWLINLFSGNSNTTTLSPDNTLPSQTTDGFVQESGMGDALKIALLLAAGGAVLASGGLNTNRKKASK